MVAVMPERGVQNHSAGIMLRRRQAALRDAVPASDRNGRCKLKCSTENPMAESTATAAASPTTQASQRRSRLFMFGVAILVLTIGGVSIWAYKEIQSAEHKLEENLALRAGLIVDGRVDAIDTHLKSMRAAAGRLVDAEMFKYFAFEVDQFDGDVGMLVAPGPKGGAAAGSAPGSAEDRAEKVAEQLPLWVVNLRDFTVAEGFVSGRVVNRKGDTYISTMATPVPMRKELQDQVRVVLESGRSIITPVYSGPLGLAHDIIIPIMAPAFEQGSKPVSALVLSKAATGKNSLSELVGSSSVAAEGFVTRFIQRTTGGFEEVGLGASADIRKIGAPEGLDKDRIPFGMRASVGGKEQVYSMGRKVPGTDWWIIQERDYAASRLDYRDSVRNILGLAFLTSLALALLVTVFWWRLVGKEQEEIAQQLRELSTVIGEQKQLLDGINSTMSDPISLTDAKGVYRYVNLAFASAVGREPEDVMGLDTAAVFGFDTARRLGASDQQVLADQSALTVDETIWLQSKRHFFQISKAPLQNVGEGGEPGIVSVFRDITKQVEAQERGSRMVQQTIDALVRAIEASDPFLGGHSRIMGSIAALMAKNMNLSERDVATISTAASLSQIGKMFVPREVLTKPGLLTDEEKKQMEQHVEYAREVLKDIEFELPVLDAVYQMNERLDGRGYPRQLAGEEIDVAARVLAVANAFTAMARPRSYRPAMQVADVLTILEKQSDAYDPSVVAALGAVLKTPAGERIVAQAASSKAS